MLTRFTWINCFELINFMREKQKKHTHTNKRDSEILGKKYAAGKSEGNSVVNSTYRVNFK